MKGLRRVLADSHVAAATIAVLLLWALDAAVRGLWDPVCKLGAFVIAGIAIRDIPYISPRLTVFDRLMLITTGYFAYLAIVCVLGAWLLSRWVYGTGPLRSLTACRNELMGRKHA